MPHGILLIFQPSSNGHSSTPVEVSIDNGNKEERQNGSKVTPGGPVGPKDQLDYMVKVLGLTAVYQEFPKKQNASPDEAGDDANEEDGEAKGDEDEVFTLLSISTEPPQVNLHIRIERQKNFERVFELTGLL